MTNSPTRRFGSTYPSSLDASRDACAELNKFWQLTGIEEAVSAQVELCIVEMMNNAFLHAYQQQEGLPIELVCELFTDSTPYLTLSVSDCGSAMSQQELDSKLNNQFIEPDPDDDTTWTTSGRGFIIVSSLMDSVELKTEGDKNTFVMKKELSEID
ncbi:ATP-binding protein [Vibrio panuliri]|uniref:Anti-sigma F factor antagonist n=1 Tax=Vibrio panuliri TaxID=1381081 RepID=A0A1Q9HRJ4_9VIBR|nr:ATP-binding protein [Vibrio panuliri]KAB1457123.1 ATP-binding protein [Vibrio panuliri]OLQ84796.1 anti-sigma F factor antagonist [Vibrio panuliri]OLQ93507.1 anti-sigma F factor antagonist [Vibrio panuliri]